LKDVIHLMMTAKRSRLKKIKLKHKKGSPFSSQPLKILKICVANNSINNLKLKIASFVKILKKRF
ncbi:MAG: hypothetical protein L0G10_15755, partial [Acinetobacter sp.]|nr:hypothetical protein [Acinetobacter sp.]